MTPYERIAIYQRLDHDRDVAEKDIPCSAFGNCRGVRDPHRSACPACPLGATEQREPWQERFLFHLAALGKVGGAIRAARMNSGDVYEERRNNPEFSLSHARASLAGLSVTEADQLPQSSQKTSVTFRMLI